MIEYLPIYHIGSGPPLFDIIDDFFFCTLNVVRLVLVRLLVGYSFVVLVTNNTLTLIWRYTCNIFLCVLRVRINVNVNNTCDRAAG